jgi:hypothetical protein
MLDRYRCGAKPPTSTLMSSKDWLPSLESKHCQDGFGHKRTLTTGRITIIASKGG